MDWILSENKYNVGVWEGSVSRSNLGLYYKKPLLWI